MKSVVVGGENFRPVGLVIGGSGGAIYFTDWVDKSYTLHGKGRIWKLSPRKEHDTVGTVTVRCGISLGDLSPEVFLKWARESETRLVAEKSIDPFDWQSSSSNLSGALRRTPKLNDDAIVDFYRSSLIADSVESAIWNAVAIRDARAEYARPLVPVLLNHDEPRVRLLGVMWVGDGKLTEFREEIIKGLSRPGLTRELFECSLAALEMLEPKQSRVAIPVVDNKRKNSGDYFAIEALRNPESSVELRRFALKTLPPTHPELKFELLEQLTADVDPAMRIEAIRTLRDRPAEERGDRLRSIAADEKHDVADRAEAVIGLNRDAAADRSVLDQLTSAKEAAVADEAKRLLRAPANDSRPPSERIATISAGGDAVVGERLFFHSKVAACYRCHEYAGRGAKIGPDLTTIHRTASREKLLQSILEPSREIGPSFVPWLIETTDGRALIGLYVGEEVDGRHRYAEPTGKIFLLHPNDIERREAAKQSIMPADLAKSLTDDELRDLAAFLLRP